MLRDPWYRPEAATAARSLPEVGLLMSQADESQQRYQLPIRWQGCDTELRWGALLAVDQPAVWIVGDPGWELRPGDRPSVSPDCQPVPALLGTSVTIKW